jgi:uncharacterized membrane protein YdjX (TVP38/TMEM64 family)
MGSFIEKDVYMEKRTIRKLCLAAFIIAFLAAVYFLIGRPMLAFVGDQEALNAYIDERGIVGWLIFIGLIVVQTISTTIPGTPFYLAAGFILGGVKGALVCDLGATIGNTIAFLLGKKFGRTLLDQLFSEERLKSVEEMVGKHNPILIHVAMMLLPLPKDTYAWLGYSSKENLLQWIPITFICRFPHIFVYTFGGAMLLQKNYTVLIIGATFAVLLYAGIMLYIRKTRLNNK